MNQQLYDILAGYARRGERIPYGRLATQLGIDADNLQYNNAFWAELGEVSRYERDHKRPLLSAIAVNADTKIPGKGFYSNAVELDLLAASADELEREVFAGQQIEAVWQTWRTP